MRNSSTSLSQGISGASRWNVRHLFLLVPWVGLGYVAFRPIRDNSFLWHIQAGLSQAQQGQVLVTDPYSLSFVGEPWRTQSWLVDIGYAWMYDRFLFGFVSVWVVVLGGILFLSLGIRTYRRSRTILVTASVLAGISWMGLAYLAPRPIIVSFAALGLLVLVVEHRSLGWATPLVIWVWAATHGSFIIGIGYLVLQALRTREIRFLRQAGVGFVVSSLTAHGYHVWGILWAFFLNREALEVIQEWATPQLIHLVMWPYAVVISLVMVGLARQSISKRDLWVIIPFLLFGLTSQRALFVASIVLAPWVVFPRQRPQERLGSGFSVRVLAALAVVIIVVPIVFYPPQAKVDETKFPTQALDFVTDDPLFHDDGVGGYLILAGEGRPVLVDDRAELYGREFFDRVISAESGAPGWQELFSDLGINQALLRSDDGLKDALVDAGWTTRYQDDWFIVLVNS